MLEIYMKKKKDMQALGWWLFCSLKLFHLELKYYSEVSWNYTNTGAVILLNVCISASGSYLPKTIAGYFEN